MNKPHLQHSSPIAVTFLQQRELLMRFCSQLCNFRLFFFCLFWFLAEDGWFIPQIHFFFSLADTQGKVGVSGETQHFVGLAHHPGAAPALIKVSAAQRCHLGVSSLQQEKTAAEFPQCQKKKKKKLQLHLLHQQNAQFQFRDLLFHFSFLMLEGFLFSPHKL